MSRLKAQTGQSKTKTTNRQTEAIRLLIAEDTTLVRYGLSQSLRQVDNFTVLDEAVNGKQIVDMALKYQPDIILMDCNMPVMDGLDATVEIKHSLPNCKIIMISEDETAEKALDAIKRGADGYCLKSTSLASLANIINLVHQGMFIMGAGFCEQLKNAIPQSVTRRKTYTTPINLTAREREVLTLIVAGKSNKEIALGLEMTFHTAKAHVCRIIQKLGVEDRTQVAVKTLEEGLL